MNPMSRAAYNLALPDHRTTAAVFASPHSGRNYPWSFIRASQLDEVTIRSSEDAFVDRLYSDAPGFGAPFLEALTPRAYVDLNRAEDELDPALINGVRQTRYNPRVAAGLGVIPRVVANGREIRSGKIGLGEARRRLTTCYHPYHQMLRRLTDESREKFGFALLFDCHSMPHEALAATSYAFDKKPDVVLGDRFGAACAPEFTDAAARAFEGAGLRVSRNLPFAGAFVTKNYGKPNIGMHALQIEIDRALYMDEATITPRADFSEFRQMLRDITRQLAEMGRGEIKLAAE